MYFTQALHRALQQHPTRGAMRYGSRQRSFVESVDRVARLAAMTIQRCCACRCN